LRTFNIISAAALLAISGAASALDFSANVELDNTFKSGNIVKNTDNEGISQSGRVELNASGKAGANLFVAGKAAFLAKKDGTVATDDMWVQMGSQAFDVKLGRFEGVDLFPLPGDTVVENAGDVYKTNALRGRIGDSVFHGALTAKLGGGLAVELGLIETKAAGKTKGVRPAVTYANGPLSLGVGFESAKTNATPANPTATPPTAAVASVKGTGFGGFAQYDFGGFKLTGNFAQGKTDVPGGSDLTDTAFALIAGFGPANLGFISAKNEQGAGTPDEKVTTIYGSYALPLFDVKGATITPAFSTSTAKQSGAPSAKINAVRVRINYTF
jgi:hypothetical protein